MNDTNVQPDSRAANPVPLPAPENFHVALPLVRAVQELTADWQSELVQELNTNSASFLEQLQTAEIAAASPAGAPQFANAALQISAVQLGCTDDGARAGVFDRLEITGTVSGLESETVSCLLVLSAYITRQNVTGENPPSLFAFRQRLPKVTFMAAAEESTERWELPPVVARQLPDVNLFFATQDSIVASPEPSPDSPPERYMSILVFDRGAQMDHPSFQRMVAEMNSRMELGDSLWPTLGSLLVPYDHAWEVFGWCTGDANRLNYCTAHSFERNSQDVWLSHMRMQAQSAEEEDASRLPKPKLQ